MPEVADNHSLLSARKKLSAHVKVKL